jgi:hypothetical protein
LVRYELPKNHQAYFDETRILDPSFQSVLNENKQNCHICNKNLKYDDVITPILCHDLLPDQSKKIHVSHYDCFVELKNIFEIPTKEVEIDYSWLRGDK